MAISPHEFSTVRRWIKEQAALIINKDKEYLVTTRLEPLARQEGFESISKLIAQLDNLGLDNPLYAKVIDALTTNETSFFRDTHPFEELRKSIIPEIRDHKAKRELAIWSGACASGQELFSIAMILSMHFPDMLNSWKLQLLGTDLSDSSLQKARQGSFSQFEVNRGLPAQLLVRYFTQEGKYWQLKRDILDMVNFQKFNIIKPWPPGFPTFDIILMRNILIYFDDDTRAEILKQLRRSIKSEGYLFLGTAENAAFISKDWKLERRAKTTFYRPV